MIDRTTSPDGPMPGPDLRRALDERSMRILELGLAGMALVSAILLAGVR